MVLVALAIFLPLALAARIIAGRWLHPGAMFAGYWLLAGTLPVASFASTQVTAVAMAYIAVGVAVVSIGALVSSRLPTATRNPTTGQADSTLRHRPLLILAQLGTASAAAAAALAIHAHGLDFHAVLSLQGLLQTGNSLAVARYAGMASTGAEMLLLAVAYGASLAAPFLLLTDARRAKLWSVAPVLAVAFYSAVTTARLGMLIAVALNVGARVAVATMRNAGAPAVRGKSLMRVAAAAAVVAVAFSSIAFVRLGRVDAQAVPIVRQKLAVYAFAYEPAFSHWLDEYRSPTGAGHPLGLGSASLAGLSWINHRSRLDYRAYGEFVMVDDVGTTTNIYTMWRGLLLDFGEPGALLVLFAGGLLAGHLFRRTVGGAPTSTTALGACYGVCLLSVTMSVLTYTNVCLGVALGIFAVHHCTRPVRAKKAATTRNDMLRELVNR